MLFISCGKGDLNNQLLADSPVGPEPEAEKGNLPQIVKILEVNAEINYKWNRAAYRPRDSKCRFDFHLDIQGGIHLSYPLKERISGTEYSLNGPDDLDWKNEGLLVKDIVVLPQYLAHVANLPLIRIGGIAFNLDANSNFPPNDGNGEFAFLGMIHSSPYPPTYPIYSSLYSRQVQNDAAGSFELQPGVSIEVIQTCE